jgi:hypothetical protein
MTRNHVRPKFLDPKNPGGTIKICIECNVQESLHLADEYRAFAVSKNREPYKSFLETMYEIEALASLPLPDKKLHQSLMRTLFAAVITAMETYLSFLNRVLLSDMLLKRCIETNPDLRDRKLALGDIFARQENLKDEVRNYILDVLFHNIFKIKLMYRSVLNVDFPGDLADIARAIESRHDIVHRSGRSKSGSINIVSAEGVRSLVTKMKDFIIKVEGQL